MQKIKIMTLAATALVFATPHVQAASIDIGGRSAAPAPLIDAPVTSKSLAGKAEQRKGGRGMRGGGGRGFRGGHRGANRGFRGGGRHFSGRNVNRGHRGYRGGHRNFRGRDFRGNRGFRGGRHFRGRHFRGRHYRGRNFGLGFASGVFLGSALSYPRYSSYGYPTYGYPAYGYPSYGFYDGYQRCRYRGRYYDASFCYNFPYGYRRVYSGYEGRHGHRHYHGRHCHHDRRHHGYYREY